LPRTRSASTTSRAPTVRARRVRRGSAASVRSRIRAPARRRRTFCRGARACPRSAPAVRTPAAPCCRESAWRRGSSRRGSWPARSPVRSRPNLSEPVSLKSEVGSLKSSDQAIAQRLRDRLGFRVDLQLVVNAAEVKADGVYGDAELRGGGLVIVAFDEQSKQ